MIDREKVQKGLYLCLSGESSACNNCPYDAECKEAISIGPSPLRHDALELLKEQEPVKPIERNGFWYCGKCRYALMTNHQKFCSDCGREVKWE